MTKAIVALALAAALTGCSGLTEQQQRALSGAGIGAAGGAVLTVITGGSVLVGTALGGAAGAAAGALIDPKHH